MNAVNAVEQRNQEGGMKEVKDGKAPETAKWAVEVHFAIDSYPRIVATFAKKEDAEREARIYLGADAKSVRVREVK